MNRQVVDRADVVLAQERRTLGVGPVGRQRRDGVKGTQPNFERAGGVAIRDRHTALKLRHHDNVERIGGDRGEIVLPNEVDTQFERLPRGRDHAITWRDVGIRLLQRGDDHLLLLFGQRIFGELSIRFLFELNLPGDHVHLGPHATQFKFGAVSNLLSRQSGAECERELLVVEFGPDSRVASRVG